MRCIRLQTVLKLALPPGASPGVLLWPCQELARGSRCRPVQIEQQCLGRQVAALLFQLRQARQVAGKGCLLVFGQLSHGCEHQGTEGVDDGVH